MTEVGDVDSAVYPLVSSSTSEIKTISNRDLSNELSTIKGVENYLDHMCCVKFERRIHSKKSKMNGLMATSPGQNFANAILEKTQWQDQIRVHLDNNSRSFFPI